MQNNNMTNNYNMKKKTKTKQEGTQKKEVTTGIKNVNIKGFLFN